MLGAIPVTFVRTLTTADLDHITAIHCAAFPKSLLTALGPSVVRRYYEWQLSGPHDAVAVGVEQNGEVAGFCVAGRFRGSVGGFVRANRLRLACGLLCRPWLLGLGNYRRRVTRGVRLFLPSIAGKAVPVVVPWPMPSTFGVLVIAVNPKYGRSGCGRLLMNHCEQIAVDRNFSRLMLTVDPNNGGAIRFYEGLGWVKLLHGNRWNNVMVKPLPSSQARSDSR